MTPTTAPSRPVVRPLDRLAPLVFSHARLAMLTVTGAGVVVDVNPAAATLFDRPPSELVQEPIERHVELRSGEPLAGSLWAAARAAGPQSLGAAAIRRRSGASCLAELVVSSGCHASGRELLLLQLVLPSSAPRS